MSVPHRVAHIATIDLSLDVLLGFQMHRMRDRGYEAWGIAGSGGHAEQLRARGLRVLEVPHLGRRSTLVDDSRAVAELFGLLREHAFDIVHTHTPKAGLYGRLASRLSSRARVVHTIHGLYFDEHSSLAQKGLVWAIERAGATMSDHIFCQNPDDLEVTRRLRIVPPDRVSLLGNGVDLQRFHPTAVPDDDAHAVRAELGIGRDAVVVGMVARLVANKGYDWFFEAARRLKRTHPHAVFVSVGQLDPDKPDAMPQSEVDSLTAEGIIVHAGTRTDMERVYAMMDVAVLPSRYPEGIPRALMEPAAMGTPLVTTNQKGCREVVVEGENGFIIEHGELEAFVARIAHLVESQELRRRMGMASRAIAQERFDENDVVDRTLAVYDHLLAE
jgi:glycosyltransferase involved in cell wall biosynthesis